jgi:hypothetical protein
VSVPSSDLGPPTPSPLVSVSPPLDQKGEEQYSLAGEGVGGPNSDDWKESLALCIVYTESVTINVHEVSLCRVWHLRRSLDDLQALDRQLHTCVYDRKYSQLPVIPQLENISANGNSLQVREK